MDFQRRKGPPTLQDLADKAAAHWTEVAKIREGTLMEMRKVIEHSPDEKARPDPQVAWSHPGIVCPTCLKDQFSVPHWVTINGARHRFVGICLACRHEGVYDWGSGGWLT